MKSNEDLRDEFVKDMVIQKSIGKLRADKYRYKITKLSSMLGKSFLDMTEEDKEKLVLDIKKREWADWTKKDFLTSIKIFGNWLNAKYGKAIRYDTVKAKTPRTVIGSLITDEELEKIISCCSSSRDKAFFSLLWDSGCRLGELLNLRIEDVVFDDYGTILLVNGKTGQRRVRCIDSTPLLYEYIDNHPRKKDPKAYLWYSDFDRINRGKVDRPISNGTVYKLLREVCKKAGIKKRIHPHLFRHTRATFYADKLTEIEMDEQFGWTLGSSMVRTYVHRSGRNTDNGILKAHGIKRNEDNPKTLFISRYTKKNEAVDNIIFEFLKALAEENPKIKEKFKALAKEKNLRGLIE